jgi:hypothetical protein
MSTATVALNAEQIKTRKNILGMLKKGKLSDIEARTQLESAGIPVDFKTPEELQAESDMKASAMLMACVNAYSENLSSASKLGGAEKLAAAIASGTVKTVVEQIEKFAAAASEARDSILKTAKTNPGASTTLFDGDSPLFNPAVSNPDNPRGANSWSPRDLVLLLNRNSMKSLTRLRSSRKA